MRQSLESTLFEMDTEVIYPWVSFVKTEETTIKMQDQTAPGFEFFLFFFLYFGRHRETYLGYGISKGY
jgi:hypothetical protein